MRFPILFSICMYIVQFGFAQDQIQTSVYGWNPSETMFKGAGAVLSNQELKGHVLRGGKKLKFNSGVNGPELFFIVKEGPVRVHLNGAHHDLDKGSVVFVLSGDEVVFQNTRKDEIEFYEMQMDASSRDVSRGKGAGGSFVINWYDMVFKPHDRGGVRQLFDRKTITMNRFDIHITSLNPGLKSHEPHTHKNEEIILMVDGDGEMVLGNERQRITTGGAAWVESNIPHNITNMGKRPAVYFAIQWN